MKCAKCGYSLWNLPEPRCPECGQSFNVEDWTFESGTVRFHCNACHHPLMHRQPGYGPARCNNCNEVIAWSDVRVVPVGEAIAHKSDRDRMTEGFPFGPALLVFGVLAFWSMVLMPAKGGRASPFPLDFVIVASAIGLGVTVAGVLLASRGNRIRAVSMYGAAWLAFTVYIWWLAS